MQVKKGVLESLMDECSKLMIRQEDVRDFRLETPVLRAVAPIPKYDSQGVHTKL